MSKFNFNIDIDDNKDRLSKSSFIAKTQKDEYLKSLVIDMGFESNILWAQYNLGVSLSNLNVHTGWYGDYYAWGEIQPKENYTWDTYKYAENETTLTKYCVYNEKEVKWHDKYHEMDNKYELENIDDAAYMKFGEGWKIPSKKDFNELLKNSTNIYVNEYNGIPNLRGRVFTSKINRNELFFPATSYKINSQLNEDTDGYDGYYWSSTIVEHIPNEAYHLSIFKEHYGVGGDQRYVGFSIRPIYKKED